MIRIKKRRIYTCSLRLIALLIVLAALLSSVISCNEGSELNTDEDALPKEVLSEEQLFEKLSPSIIKVIRYDYDGTTVLGQGTGFFIDDKGTFITNAHVVKNCYFLRIKNYQGITFDVDKIYVFNDFSSDHAICGAVMPTPSKPVEFESAADIGDTVYAFGYPNNTNILKVTTGEITNNNSVSNKTYYYSNTAKLEEGSSGGALVNEYGKVLGITTGLFDNGSYATIKYDCFKGDTRVDLSSGKVPYSVFYDFKNVSLSQSEPDNLYNCFNVLDNGDGIYCRNIVVKLKPDLALKNVKLQTPNITLKVILDVRLLDQSYNNEIVYTKSLKFKFYSSKELCDGKSYEVIIPRYLIPEDISVADVSYDLSIEDQSGAFIIFE